MSESLYRKIKRTCTEQELLGISMPLSAKCEELITGKMTEEVRHGGRSARRWAKGEAHLYVRGFGPGSLGEGTAGLWKT
jgi:hypothetical protein